MNVCRADDAGQSRAHASGWQGHYPVRSNLALGPHGEQVDVRRSGTYEDWAPRDRNASSPSAPRDRTMVASWQRPGFTEKLDSLFAVYHRRYSVPGTELRWTPL